MIGPQTGKDAIAFAPQALTHGATASAALDTIGADYASIRITLASEANTNATGPTISLLQSDDTVVTNHATITADRAAEDITAAKVLTYHVDLRGKKRYLRLTVTPPSGSTNNNITAGALSTLSRQVEAPGATTDMADAAVIV